MDAPPVRYVTTVDGVSIAYWALGSGPPLVQLPSLPHSHIGVEWETPEWRRGYEIAATATTVVRYDGRGTGLSQRDVTDFSLAALMFYWPANVYPILRMDLYGGHSENTVLQGALSLFDHGQHLVAVVVILASVVIPLLNRPGFYERSVYVNPLDGQNMNRMFPGDPAGSWSERFAHHFLEGVAARSDGLVDLHAGDLIEDLEPFVIWRETGDAALDTRTRRMVDAYGARWAVRALPSGERPGLLYAAAAARGVAAMIAESGRCGLLEEAAVTRHVRGVLNVLRADRSGEVFQRRPPRAVDDLVSALLGGLDGLEQPRRKR